MTAFAEAYEADYEFSESFDEMELTEEAVRGRFRPAKKVFFPGALSSATLHTPKGPATLNLPSPVPTLTQFRSLEQTVNGTSARLNAVQTALARITREVGARRRDPSGQSNMMMMMFSLLGQKKLRDDLAGHTHTGSDAKAVLPTTSSSSSSLTSILPFILLMQPNAFGGSAAGQDNNAMGGLLPILLISTILD
jgi:hypothetical protein